MRVVLTGVLILFSFLLTFGQQPDHWINYGQPHFRIPVARDGLFRVTYSDLEQAGFPVNSADPTQFQLFHRGIEQAIHVKGEQDNQFNTDDYIEFFGRKNDGTLDTDLYKPSTKQPHTYYNLFSDTSQYFLTWGISQGKRIPFKNTSEPGTLIPESYHWDEKLIVLTEQYLGGENAIEEFYSSTYDAGEGWLGQLISRGQSRTISFTGITSLFGTGPEPELEILFNGEYAGIHTVEVYVGETTRLAATITFNDFEKYLFKTTVTSTDFSASGELKIQVRLLDPGMIDRMTMGFLRLTYPQFTDAANAAEKYFSLRNTQELLLQVSNVPAQARFFDLTDPASVAEINFTGSATRQGVLTSSTSPRKIFFTTQFLSPGKIVKASFRKINPAEHDYIIISHPVLRKPGGKYSDPVKAFAEYRASESGGSHDTLVVNMRMLYDQFNYGEVSPRAIYKFLEYLTAQKKPSYLFLIGKGVELWYNSHRRTDYGGLEFVPASGFPASDVLYSVGLDPSYPSAPAIPTGRLSAVNSLEVASYLDKVIETEAVPYDSLWKKNILHLSGGIEEWEPAFFRSILQSYATIAEGPYLGGNVKAIAKNSRDIKLINIAEEVNNGLGLVTFFGHSSPATLDFDIGNVTNDVLGYHNKGKYPVLFMNGCQAGAFFGNYRVFGEDWMVAANRGAIGFLAHNGFAGVPALDQYARRFYSVAYGDSVYIHKGLGDVQREVCRKYILDNPNTLESNTQFQQMILLGDPAVKLFGAKKPDLDIKEAEVSLIRFNNKPLDVLADSFALKFIVRNHGVYKPGNYRVEVKRTFNNSNPVIYDSIYTLPAYSDTVLFILRRGSEPAGGTNVFEIRLDPDEIIAELNEENNQAGYTAFIAANGTKNLFPNDFSIVNDKDIKLTFQSSDLLSAEREFLIELDTVQTFSSPYLKQFRVNGEVLINAPVTLLSADTLAYYWRTKLAAPTNLESNEWTTSSFTYIQDGQDGWAQVHFPQLLSDDMTGLIPLDEARKITFEKSITPVEIITFGAGANKPVSAISVKIKGAEYNLYFMSGGWFACRTNTFNLIAFNRSSTSPYAGVYRKWYQPDARIMCGREPFVINSFTAAEVDRNYQVDLLQYVDNIETGDSVIMYTMGNPNIPAWSETAKTKLGHLGVGLAQLNELVPGEPVVIFGKKGSSPGSARILRSDSPDPLLAKLQVNGTVTGGFTSGTIESGIVGPAKKWTSFNASSSGLETTDSVRFTIRGMDLAGNESVLLEGIKNEADLTHINPVSFPYLKITYTTADPTLLTAAQLKRWIVHYTAAPEGILIPKKAPVPVTMMEGETMVSNYAFINISDESFPDSLVVRTSLFNQLKNKRVTTEFKVLSPLPGDTSEVNVKRSTIGFEGLNDLDVYVNPVLVPELYYENNLVQRLDYLNVKTDKLKPVLDVIVDGRRLVSGDFVSTSPKIQIRIHDENQFLFLRDTTQTRIFLQYPCETEPCAPIYIAFSRTDVSWTPGDAGRDFQVNFQPELKEGSYVLRVESADAKGNINSQPYEVSFVVEDNPLFAFINPNPNPVLTDLTYGFVIAGDGLPDHVYIEITDIAGRKIMTKNEDRTSLHTGRNLFYWHGTDSSGNRLNHGIYLLTVHVVLNGTERVMKRKIILQR